MVIFSSYVKLPEGKTCSICKKPCKVPLDISGSGLSRTFFGRRGGAKCSGLKSYSLNGRSQRSPLVDLGKHAANAWRYLKIPLWDIARHPSFCLVNVGRWRRNATTSCSGVGHWISFPFFPKTEVLLCSDLSFFVWNQLAELGKSNSELSGGMTEFLFNVL